MNRKLVGIAVAVLCVAVAVLCIFVLVAQPTPNVEPGVSAVEVDAKAQSVADNPDNVLNTQQLPDSSFIYDTSVVELYGNGTLYNNQTVQVTGEAIGDCLKADLSGENCWISLATTEEGSDATVSVYVSSALAELIDTYGSYAATGTMVQVRGTFHAVCDEHEGESDLHATSLTVVKSGEVRAERFDMRAFAPGLLLLAVGGLLALLYVYLRERGR